MLRWYPLPLTERVIATLRESRYLDDAGFARHWRANRERHRPRSPEMVRQELGRFGVSREVIDEALEGFDAADNAYRAAHKLATRLARKEYPYFRQRLWAYLRRRGFGGAIISQAVERLWQELADPTHGDKDAQDDEK
jgi:regulatory protein